MLLMAPLLIVLLFLSLCSNGMGIDGYAAVKAGHTFTVRSFSHPQAITS